MAIESMILSAVIAGAKAAWELYNMGFSKAKQAPRLYLEFGVAIQGLARNLDFIEKIIRNAEQQLRERRLHDFGPDPFDLSAFDQIVGNYAVTLDKCNALLDNNRKYWHDRQGFVYNVIWNLNVEPAVVRLKDKIAFHNIKIVMIMETVEIKMLKDLETLILQTHQDQSERLSRIEDQLQEVHRLFVQPSKQDLSPELSRPEVPFELSQKFEKVVFGNGQDLTTFPLEEGLNAFFRHFKDQTLTLDVTSYLNLMKSMWIMDKLLACGEFKRVPPGSLYDRCVREMNRKLRRELDRTNRNRIPFPDIMTVLQLSENDFQIWMTDPEVDELDDEALEVLIDLSLPGINNSEHTLRVLSNLDGTLRLENKLVTTTTTGACNIVDRDRLQFDFELAKVYLIPLYMRPGSTSGAPSLKFGGDGSNKITPTFGNTNDLLRFQHLITGYKTVGIRESITVTYLGKVANPKGRGRGKQKLEHVQESGKLQIWNKNPFINDPADTNRRGTFSSVGQERRLSKQSSFSLPRTKGTFSSGPSTTESSIHRQVHIGDSMIATTSHMPEPPLLVLFLERENKLLSFLVITMDRGTDIDPSACDCRKNANCPAVVIKRKSGNLTVHSFSTTDANDWNVAIFGAHSNRNDKNKAELPWLRVDFPNFEERIKFGTKYTNCRTIFDGKMNEYHSSMRRVSTRNVG